MSTPFFLVGRGSAVRVVRFLCLLFFASSSLSELSQSNHSLSMAFAQVNQEVKMLKHQLEQSKVKHTFRRAELFPVLRGVICQDRIVSTTYVYSHGSCL